MISTLNWEVISSSRRWAHRKFSIKLEAIRLQEPYTLNEFVAAKMKVSLLTIYTPTGFWGFGVLGF